jgi:excisionase family DNA binding protein
MKDRQDDQVFTIDELSAYLKIAKSTLYKLAQEGRLPSQKVGRHWRFHREAVDEWLGKSRRPPRGGIAGDKQ